MPFISSKRIIIRVYNLSFNKAILYESFMILPDTYMHRIKQDIFHIIFSFLLNKTAHKFQHAHYQPLKFRATARNKFEAFA